MPSGKTTPEISVRTLVEDLWSGWKAQALAAAIEFDVFTHLATGRRTAGQISAATGANPRGMRGLLDVLVAMNYLGKRGDSYKLRDTAEMFLVKGRRPYLGELACLMQRDWESWRHLADSIRSGRPRGGARASERAANDYPRLAAMFFDVHYPAACAAVQAVLKKTRKGIQKILDVAAGSGVWSIAFAQALPEAKVTAFDSGPALHAACQLASRMGVENRYTFVEGNLHGAEFGREDFDLVILGEILHEQGPVRGRELIGRVAGALRQGGTLLTVDFVANDVRTKPLIPLLFGLNMLLHTSEGDVFTLREYRSWLKQAGMRTPRIAPTSGLPAIILASK